MEELKGVCEIGKLMSKSSCHKTWYEKEKRYKQLCELFNDDIVTLFWRAGCKSYLEGGSLVINNLIKVCFHHYCMHLTRFDKTQKKCNNPFDVHAVKKKKTKAWNTFSELKNCSAIGRKVLFNYRRKTVLRMLDVHKEYSAWSQFPHFLKFIRRCHRIL